MSKKGINEVYDYFYSKMEKSEKASRYFSIGAFVVFTLSLLFFKYCIDSMNESSARIEQAKIELEYKKLELAESA